MLNLITYPGNFGEPSDSPFCVKAMCLLEMSGQKWKPKFTSNPRKAPKQKLPILQIESQIIPDSDQIRDYLEQAYPINFDEGLTAEQQAVSRALIRMVEEHLYFAVVHDRWVNDANWAHIRKAYFRTIPFPLNGIVSRMIRKKVMGQLNGQGMGRHNSEERFERAKKDVMAIQNILGRKLFLFGDHPTAADASVVPILRASITTPVETELSSLIRQNDAVMEYLARGKEAMYSKKPNG